MTQTPPPEPAERQPTNTPHRTSPSEEPSRLGCGALPTAAPVPAPPSARFPEDTQTRAAATALTFTSTTVTTATYTISRYCVAGTIDATTCDTFGAHLDDIVAAGHPILLDLTAVPFISVGGLTLIEALARTTEQREIPWALVADHSHHRFLTLLNMDTRVPSFDNTDAALAHLTNTLAHWRPRPYPRDQ